MQLRDGSSVQVFPVRRRYCLTRARRQPYPDASRNVPWTSYAAPLKHIAEIEAGMTKLGDLR